MVPSPTTQNNWNLSLPRSVALPGISLESQKVANLSSSWYVAKITRKNWGGSFVFGSISITAFLLQTQLDWDQDWKKYSRWRDLNISCFLITKNLILINSFFHCRKGAWSSCFPAMLLTTFFSDNLSSCGWSVKVRLGTHNKTHLQIPTNLEWNFPWKINKTFVEFWWILWKQSPQPPYSLLLSCPSDQSQTWKGSQQNRQGIPTAHGLCLTPFLWSVKIY